MNDEFDYLKKLNPAQKTAVLYNKSHLLVLAGAGSGKTRVVTTRMLHLINSGICSSYNILGVTFTNKAAAEMLERLKSQLLAPDYSLAPAAAGFKGLPILKTFHSFGAWLLRRYGESIGLASNFNIYDSEDSVALVRQVYTCPLAMAKYLARLISKAKELDVASEDELRTVADEPSFLEAYPLYQKKLWDTGNVDFTDLLLLPVRLLHHNKDVRQKLQQRFQYIMVDEYQDSNFLQSELLKLLVGLHNKISVVGDEDQSIYSFRGADIDNILNFSTEYPGTKTIRLEENYRSTSPIVNIANAVIGKNERRLGKTLYTKNKSSILPQLNLFTSYEDEARFCAQEIKKNMALDTAILYRTNVQARIFETYMREYDIPYSLIGSLSFYGREEIKDALAYLAFIFNTNDEIAFMRAATKPKRGLGAGSIEKILASGKGNIMYGLQEAKLSAKADSARRSFIQLISKMLSSIATGSLNESMKLLLESSGLKQEYKKRDAEDFTERWAHLSELINMATKFGAGKEELGAFLEQVDLDGSASTLIDDAPVNLRLMTVHITKGMEFNRVFITGMEEGLFPSEENKESPESLEEERRLFYVALTRAKEELFITASRSRMHYGRSMFNNISIFLEEIPIELYRANELAQQKLHASNTKLDSTDTSDKFAVGSRIQHLDHGLGFVEKRLKTGSVITLIIKLDDGRTIRVQPQFQGGLIEYIADEE